MWQVFGAGVWKCTSLKRNKITNSHLYWFFNQLRVVVTRWISTFGKQTSNNIFRSNWTQLTHNSTKGNTVCPKHWHFVQLQVPKVILQTFAPLIYGVVLRALPVRGESHIQHHPPPRRCNSATPKACSALICPFHNYTQTCPWDLGCNAIGRWKWKFLS